MPTRPIFFPFDAKVRRVGTDGVIPDVGEGEADATRSLSASALKDDGELSFLATSIVFRHKALTRNGNSGMRLPNSHGAINDLAWEVLVSVGTLAACVQGRLSLLRAGLVPHEELLVASLVRHFCELARELEEFEQLQ